MNEKPDSMNLHQRYVNAERGGEGIPDYFEERLVNDTRNNLLQEAVFRELWYSDKPIHSLGSLESNFDESRQTIGSRLDEMVEQGILRKGSINNGDYWWIDFPDSEQPLPKDVVVHPTSESEELTVREFFNQLHIQIGIVSLFATAVGGAVVLLGAFQLTGNSFVPVPAGEILRIGLLTLFSSYIFLLFAVVTWIVGRAFRTDGYDASSIFSND